MTKDSCYSIQVLNFALFFFYHLFGHEDIASIDPFKPREVVLRDVEHYVKDSGSLGVKLIPFAGFVSNDRDLLYPICKKCAELNAIGVIMSSMVGLPGFRWRYAHPLPIDDVAQEFPEPKIHVLHGGKSKSDSTNLKGGLITGGRSQCQFEIMLPDRIETSPEPTDGELRILRQENRSRRHSSGKIVCEYSKIYIPENVKLAGNGFWI